MKKIKKTFLSIALALASVTSSMNMLSASAYEEQDSWAVYFVHGAPSGTPGLYPTDYCTIYTYGGGYQTNCTSWYSGNANDAKVLVSTPYFNYEITGTGLSNDHYGGSGTITFTFVGYSTYGICKASGTVGYDR